MARKTREETENTKALILQTALDCFYEKGFSRTTFDDIASRIDLTKGAVYWHFKNKAELLVAIIHLNLDAKRQIIGEKHLNPKNLEELKSFFLKEADYIENNEKIKKFIFFTIFQVEWSDQVFNQVISEIGEIRHYHLKTIKEALTSAQKRGEISENQDINSIACLIVSLWKGLVNSYIGRETPMSLYKTLEKGLDIIINSIKITKG